MLITASAMAIVGWRVRQSLDLPHDVVAEVAHEPAVQRRQLVDHRRPVRRQHRLERRQDPSVRGHATGSASTSTRPSRSDECRDGIASDEREAAPPLTVLDRLEQEPVLSPTSLAYAATGVSRSASSSAHTGTTV